MSKIELIELENLELSPDDVRRTPASVEADDELMASIEANGLLENLVVEPVPGSPGLYHVLAGRRRFTALSRLRVKGSAAAAGPVPCLVLEDSSRAMEVALVENVVRVNLHPADEVEIFGELVQAGNTIPQIAARFGVSDRSVEQRVRLGGVIPAVLNAYREGKCNLEAVKVFAITSDPAQQEKVWKIVENGRNTVSTWEIRRLITDGKCNGASPLARFVGVKSYEKAGGAVARDLFADQDLEGVYLEDTVLLTNLADEKLERLAVEYRTEWKWVEASQQADPAVVYRLDRLRAPVEDPSDEEAAEADRLQARLKELADDAKTVDEDAAGAEEFKNIRRRLRELKAVASQRGGFTAKQRAMAGCFLSIGREGKLAVAWGLVRPEDVPPPKGAAAPAPGHTSSTVPTSTAAAPGKQGYSDVLTNDLRAVRQTIIKSHLGEAFEEAFNLHLYQMARDIYQVGYHDTALSFELALTGVNIPAEGVPDLPLGWLEAETDTESFHLLRVLPVSDKQRLFAACVAAILKGQLATDTRARPELELTVESLGIDFAAEYRPAAADFWSRLNKSQIMTIAEEVLGSDWVQAHSKDKKDALVTAVAAAFDAEEEVPQGVTPEARAKALAWAPPGFVAQEPDLNTTADV